MLRRKGVLARGRVIAIQTKPSIGGSIGDPRISARSASRYGSVLSLEVWVGDEPRFDVKRLSRSTLGLIAGDEVVARYGSIARTDPKSP